MPSSDPIDYKKIFTPIDDAQDIWRRAPADAFATDQARAILQEILPNVLSRFVRKNADYGNTAVFLGARGQFADINPKFWKLKRALWDGEQLIGESAEEILHDLIGHCLLSLYFLELDHKERDIADRKPHPAGPIADAPPLPYSHGVEDSHEDFPR